MRRSNLGSKRARMTVVGDEAEQEQREVQEALEFHATFRHGGYCTSERMVSFSPWAGNEGPSWQGTTRHRWTPEASTS